LKKRTCPNSTKSSADLLKNHVIMKGEFVSIGLGKITFPVEEIYSADLCH